jgi:hypothetical protein
MRRMQSSLAILARRTQIEDRICAGSPAANRRPQDMQQTERSARRRLVSRALVALGARP